MTQLCDGVYVSSRRDADTLANEQAIDSVVSLSSNPVDSTTEHTPISDGLNEHADFVNAVETTIHELLEVDSVLVHCYAGESRSVVVVAASLAAIHGINFEDMLDAVIEDVPGSDPAEPLIIHAREYFEGEGVLRQYCKEYGVEEMFFVE